MIHQSMTAERNSKRCFSAIIKSERFSSIAHRNNFHSKRNALYENVIAVSTHVSFKSVMLRFVVRLLWLRKNSTEWKS